MHDPICGLGFLLRQALKPVTGNESQDDIFMRRLAVLIADGGTVSVITEHVLLNRNVRFEVQIAGVVSLISPEYSLTDNEITDHYHELLACISVIYDINRQRAVDQPEKPEAPAPVAAKAPTKRQNRPKPASEAVPVAVAA